MGGCRHVVALVRVETALGDATPMVDAGRYPGATCPRGRRACASCRPVRYTPSGRKWSPIVISPALSGTKFQLARASACSGRCSNSCATAAHRRLHVGAVEDHAARRQRVEIRRLQRGWPKQDRWSARSWSHMTKRMFLVCGTACVSDDGSSHAPTLPWKGRGWVSPIVGSPRRPVASRSAKAASASTTDPAPSRGGWVHAAQHAKRDGGGWNPVRQSCSTPDVGRSH